MPSNVALQTGRPTRRGTDSDVQDAAVGVRVGEDVVRTVDHVLRSQPNAAV